MFPVFVPDSDKEEMLKNAGYVKVIDQWVKTTRWNAPHCMASFGTLEEAWQAFVRGKRCEQPLVKEPE